MLHTTRSIISIWSVVWCLLYRTGRDPVRVSHDTRSLGPKLQDPLERDYHSQHAQRSSQMLRNDVAEPKSISIILVSECDEASHMSEFFLLNGAIWHTSVDRKKGESARIKLLPPQKSHMTRLHLNNVLCTSYSQTSACSCFCTSCKKCREMTPSLPKVCLKRVVSFPMQMCTA